MLNNVFNVIGIKEANTLIMKDNLILEESFVELFCLSLRNTSTYFNLDHLSTVSFNFIKFSEINGNI